jgi:hypothetical protein
MTSRWVTVGIVLALLLCAAAASAREETLRWTHPAPETIARFQVHWGLASRLYPNTLDVGVPEEVDGVFSHTLNVTPDDAVVFFAVTAVDDLGLGSELSNERSRDELGDPGDPTAGAWGSVVSGTETFSVKSLGKSKLPSEWTFAFGAGAANSFTAEGVGGQTYSGTYVAGGKKNQKLTLTLDAISQTNLAAVLNDALPVFENVPADATITLDTADIKAKLKQDSTMFVVKGKLKLRMSSPTEGERKGRLKLKHEGAVVVVE